MGYSKSSTGRKVKAVKRREHAKFKLNGVNRGGAKRRIMVAFVFCDFDLDSLRESASTFTQHPYRGYVQRSV